MAVEGSLLAMCWWMCVDDCFGGCVDDIVSVFVCWLLCVGDCVLMDIIGDRVLFTVCWRLCVGYSVLVTLCL